MTNIVSIRRLKPGDRVTPQSTAMERLHSGESAGVAALISVKSFERIQEVLGLLLEKSMDCRSLSDETINEIEGLGGLCHEEVFDLVFAAHFEMSAAEETLRLLKASYPQSAD